MLLLILRELNILFLEKSHNTLLLLLLLLLLLFEQKNAIKPHVQFFLKMNTWMFETYRREYNYIKSIIKKCAFFGSYYISVSQCTVQIT